MTGEGVERGRGEGSGVLGVGLSLSSPERVEAGREGEWCAGCGGLFSPDPLLKFYRPSSPSSSYGTLKGVLPPHFTDVETGADWG